MPSYTFRSKTGEVLERFFHMDDAPAIGSILRVGGKRYTRVPDRHEAAAKRNIHFESISLPRGWAYAKKHGPTGKPQFDSMREVREAERRSQDAPHEADRMIYDE